MNVEWEYLNERREVTTVETEEEINIFSKTIEIVK
jgi:hypothetical protein